MNIKELIPKNKFDESGIEELKKLSFEQIAPIIPELLEWLQDMNWPVASSVADILSPFTDKIIPEIMTILKTNDNMWKYWILNVFARNTTNPLFINEIERIAKSPTKGEIEDGVDELAIDILNERSLTQS